MPDVFYRRVVPEESRRDVVFVVLASLLLVASVLRAGPGAVAVDRRLAVVVLQLSLLTLALPMGLGLQ